MNSVESELVELQSRMAFQEDAISSLNEIVAKQNLEIQRLQEQLKLVYKRIVDLKPEHDEGTSESPPPHY